MKLFLKDEVRSEVISSSRVTLKTRTRGQKNGKEFLPEGRDSTYTREIIRCC